MKTKQLNWFNAKKGREKNKIIRRAMAAMRELVFEFSPPMPGKIHHFFKNQFEMIEIARLYPYGGSFIYLHALGGIKEVDYVNGHCFWRWLEEWQLPLLVVKYKMTAQSIKNSIDNVPIHNPYVKNLFEAIFGIKYN